MGESSAASHSGLRARLASLYARLRGQVVKPSRLLGIFSSLVGSHLGNSLLGFVFWTLAARTVTPAELGVGAALVAAMALFSFLGLLGVGTLLIERFKEVPEPERRPLFSTGLGVAGVGGAVVAGAGLGVVVLLQVSGVLGDLSAVTALTLVAASGIAAASLAFDQGAIGMGASNLQLQRNIFSSVARIVVLVAAILLDIRTGQAILAAWVVGMVASFFFVVIPVRRHLPRSGRVTFRQRWHLIRDHWTVAIGHYSISMAVGLSTTILPVIVASMMSATQTAYFSQAKLLAVACLVLPLFLTVALFATVNGMDGFRRTAPRTLVAGMALSLLIIIGAAVFGRYLLLLFGENYAEASYPLLLLYVCVGPTHVIKDHLVVMRRLQGRRTRGAIETGLWTAAELVGPIVGGLFGSVTTMLLGWLATSIVCALIAVPVVLKGLKKQETLT